MALENWPRLGMGAAHLGGLFADIDEATAQATLDAAWDAGVRYYDTAPWYGHGLSEVRLGRLLRAHDPAEWRLTTKVGRVYDPLSHGPAHKAPWLNPLPFAMRYDYTAEGFAASLAQSRLRLGVEKIDALVIHDLDLDHHGAAMDRHVGELMGSGLDWLAGQKAAGEIAAVGMGINDPDSFVRFAGAVEVDFFLVAMPYTLLEQGVLDGPMRICAERGISVVIGAPFASGLLADPKGAGATYNYAPVAEARRAKALAIEAVCARHGVPLPAAALQFPFLHPAVKAIIPGAMSPAQVTANAADFARPIPRALWDALATEGLVAAGSV